MLRVAIAAMSLAAACLAAAPAEMKLELVDKARSEAFAAACLDGSQPAYYIAPAASEAAKDTWVLYFKGGGWCYNETLCAERAKGTLGSSTKLPSTFEFPSGYVSTSQEGNTAFYDANRVVLWYCDGASFSGNRDGTVKAGDQTLYFRGWRNLQAIISQLKDKHNLSQAKEVLLSGGSAGGLAAFLHADYVKTLLPPSVKKYKVSPASGFFMDHVDASGAPYYPMNMRYVYNMQNASRGVNQACYTAMAPHNKDYSCIYAQNSYAFTQAPIFPLQSALDSWQMGNVYPRNVGDWKACVTNHFANCNATEVNDLNAFAASLMTAANTTKTFYRAGNGGFFHSCLKHVGEQSSAWMQYKINGKSMQEAAVEWWQADESEPASKHTYVQPFLAASSPHQANPSCLGATALGGDEEW